MYLCSFIFMLTLHIAFLYVLLCIIVHFALCTDIGAASENDVAMELDETIPLSAAMCMMSDTYK